MERVFSVKDVADRYGVHFRTVHNWIKSGQLRAFKAGRKYQIAESAIVEFERQATK